MSPTNRTFIWTLWGVSTVVLVLYFASRLNGNDRTVFVPGETSDGHYQIELACGACHGESFTRAETMQAKCEGCHADSLDEARDAHPQSKFTDPRNAERAALLDARNCVTCHVEHKPEATLSMGITVPSDFCALCHREIGVERPSHAGIAYETCASAGCHNFHDNRALYEDFLLKHLHEPALLAGADLPQRNFASIARHVESYPHERFGLEPLAAAQHDAPADLAFDSSVLEEWGATAHAASGVNCTACHADGASGAWTERPGHMSCSGCHASEVEGFLHGKHGMRLDAAANGIDLGPMQPGSARLPMKPAAADRALSCGSCHGAHRFDTAAAAVESCVGCHDDGHTTAYLDSAHGRQWLRAEAGEIDAANAVTCATCHMPRIEKSYDFGAYVHVLVQHNQSDNLRPNDKMLRPVCMQCHGLAFSIDALADPQSIRSNFQGSPAVHVESLEMAAERKRAIDIERQTRTAPAAQVSQ